MTFSKIIAAVGVNLVAPFLGVVAFALFYRWMWRARIQSPPFFSWFVLWLVGAFAHSFVLGVVRHGITRIFVLGISCAGRHGGTGLEFVSPASDVGISPERICCEHQLQRFGAGDTFGLAGCSITCELDDMDTPNPLWSHCRLDTPGFGARDRAFAAAHQAALVHQPTQGAL
jgi:hypothetical protein